MNELQVKVQQTPGSVEWNFQELKAALSAELEVYKNTVYDDKSIKGAKGDVAELRKLRTAVEDRRKEIKTLCLKPYEEIEKQAKELTALIDEPISVINARVQKYEKERKEKCKKAILEYMANAYKDINAEISAMAKNRIYDVRWENATFKEKDWKEAIDANVAAIQSDLQVIANIEEEFLEDAMKAYKRNLALADAMSKVQELRAQKERILKRQQEEAEEKRRQEMIRQAAVKKESEATPETYVDKGADRSPDPEETGLPTSPTARSIEKIGASAFKVATQTQRNGIYTGQTNEEIIRTSAGTVLIIKGDAGQVEKIKNYITFIGAKYEEVR
jgi:uncharacterized phage infection (PIP) family protein YhgE